MKQFDMDAQRADREAAAKKEARDEGPQVTQRGVTYTLPAEMPYVCIEVATQLARAGADREARAEAITSGMGNITQALFGDRYQEFLSSGVSISDVESLLEALPDLYGADPGESPASES